MLSYSNADFTRDTKLSSSLVLKNDIMYCNEDISIIFPVNYVDKELSVIDTTCSLYGVVMFCNSKNQFFNMLVPTRFEVTPDNIETISIDGDPYYKLDVYKGTPVINDMNVVVLGDMGYYTFDIFLRKGKVPFYLGYFDLLTVFNNLTKYTDNNVKPYDIVLKIIISTVARDFKDKSKQYIFGVNSLNDIRNKRVKWIAMSNIYYSYKSTMARIGGSYMKDAMLAAIVDPETESTMFENIIRQ